MVSWEVRTKSKLLVTDVPSKGHIFIWAHANACLRICLLSIPHGADFQTWYESEILAIEDPEALLVTVGSNNLAKTRLSLINLSVLKCPLKFFYGTPEHVFSFTQDLAALYNMQNVLRPIKLKGGDISYHLDLAPVSNSAECAIQSS